MNKTISQEWINILKEDFTVRQKKGLADFSAPKSERIQNLQSIQTEHFKSFLTKGLPSVQDSQWQFTHQKKWLKHLFYPAKTISSSMTPPSLSSALIKDLKNISAYHIYFHNEQKNADLDIKSLPKEIQIYQWPDIPLDSPAYKLFKKHFNRKGDGLYHLAGALSTSGFVIYIPEKIKIKNHFLCICLLITRRNKPLYGI